jgi:hypothetical protein
MPTHVALPAARLLHKMQSPPVLERPPVLIHASLRHMSSPMYVLAASGSTFSLKNVTAPVPAVAVALKDTPPPATDPAAASVLALRDPPVRVSSSRQKDGQGPTSDLTVGMRPHLLHPRKVLDTGLRLLHKHQPRQGHDLCRLLPALLLESHAGEMDYNIFYYIA